MLHLDRKFHCCILLIFICFSCKEKDDSNEKIHNYKTFSQNTASNITYAEIYQDANDSIHNWVINDLSSVGYLQNGNWQLDSLLCFNKELNKCVACYLVKDENGPMDDIHYFYGAKIKNTWYFFKGATIYLPRKMYQKDTHTPLSFAKLHEIAMKEVFGGYLIEKKTKKNLGWWHNTFAPEYVYKYEINEAWFDSHFKNKGICSDCITDEDFEKIWKINALSKWKK